jgi:type IX secretion system PorP/SprF family membrane protein
MMFRRVIFSLFSLLCLLQVTEVTGQQATGYGYGSGRNPAFAGAETAATVKVLYSSVYPSGGYGLNSFSLSFDTFLEPLHGGAGFNLKSEHPGGLMNDITGSMVYSYHLRASRDLWFFAGMGAGMIYRTYNTGRLIFPDQIDPLNGVVLPGNETINRPTYLFFDMSAGLMMIFRSLVVSLDADHLFQPDISAGAVPGATLPRSFTIQSYYRFKTSNDLLTLIPYLEVAAGGGNYLVAAGGAAEYGRLGMGILGISEMSGTNIQTSVNAGHGNIEYFYAIRFSPVSKNPGLPFVLLHQAGIQFSLNIVDKRNSIKTILFPHL